MSLVEGVAVLDGVGYGILGIEIITEKPLGICSEGSGRKEARVSLIHIRVSSETGCDDEVLVRLYFKIYGTVDTISVVNILSLREENFKSSMK